MKKQKVKQYEFVAYDTIDGFEMRLNEALRTLAEQRPEVTFYENDPTLARIEYTDEIVLEEETRAERGCRFTCGDCPKMKHIKKRDGSPDLRRVYGECDFGEMGRVWKTTPACDYLYKMIEDGRIRLTLEEDEEE